MIPLVSFASKSGRVCVCHGICWCSMECCAAVCMRALLRRLLKSNFLFMDISYCVGINQSNIYLYWEPIALPAIIYRFDYLYFIEIRNFHTWLLCAHKMATGGSGKCLTMHVRFMVEPISMYKSEPPWIVVTGSARAHSHKHTHTSNANVDKG